MVLAALIIALIALVVAIMALPTVIQMLCGKPTIRVEFKESSSSHGVVLRCLLYNPPIKNTLLLKLGVHRQKAEDIFIKFSVWDKQRKQYAGRKEMNAAIKRNGEEIRIIALPASKAPASVLVAETTPEGAFLIARGESQTFSYPLHIGEYRAEIKIAYSEYKKTVRKWFSVGKTPTDLHWLK